MLIDASGNKIQGPTKRRVHYGPSFSENTTTYPNGHSGGRTYEIIGPSRRERTTYPEMFSSTYVYGPTTRTIAYGPSLSEITTRYPGGHSGGRTYEIIETSRRDRTPPAIKDKTADPQKKKICCRNYSNKDKMFICFRGKFNNKKICFAGVFVFGHKHKTQKHINNQSKHKTQNFLCFKFFLK